MNILVVDREEEMRAALDILEQTPGNQIFQAYTGDEALALAQANQIDLIITEVFLEPMNGFTLRNKMENRHRGVRTIFLSGYDLSPYKEHTDGYEIIAKPATPQKLFPAIARTMAPPPVAAPAPVPAPAPAPAPPAAPAPAPAVVESKPAPAPVTPVAPVAAVATPAAVPTPAPAAVAAAIEKVEPAAPATPPVAAPAPAAPAPVATQLPLPSVDFAPAPKEAAAPVRPVQVESATPPPATISPPKATPAPTPSAAPGSQEAPTPTTTWNPTRVTVPKAAPTAQPASIPRAAVPAPAAAPKATPPPADLMAMPAATPSEPPPTPAAIPEATPAAATPSPAAIPRAIPSATPAAIPKATPAATPTAVPKVTPSATPAAIPKATPAATPTAVPKATPSATPAAIPRATPAATPSAIPKATPAATPAAVPKATPAATPAPSAIPRVAPSATPSAVPVATPRATPSAVPKAAVAARPAIAGDPLIGKDLGSYHIQKLLGKGKWGPVYLAIQTSMNRPVAMELLAAEVAQDEAARANFVATARAKAAVQHPHILSVYEADQAEGRYFYTHQYVDGSTLAQLAARGEGLGEPMALQTIKAVAQGLSHLHHHKIPHSIPDATDIYVGKDGLPYLSNVAQPGDEMPASQEEIVALSHAMRTVLPGGHAQDEALEAMLARMSITTVSGFQSWAPLFQTIQAIEPKVIPADAFRLSAQDKAAIRAVEETRKRQKMVVTLSIVGVIVLLFAVAAGAWWMYLRPESRAHDYSDVMVQIPAGEFVYQDGQKVTLPTYYIDKYEVTIAEYGKFLDYLKAHGDTTEFDDPLQPKGLSHIPRDWDNYFGRANAPLPSWRTVKATNGEGAGVPITLDCPVFNVNYFDAYAYAKWKGRRLPTEQEWEKAARGANGNLYPWGNQWDPSKLNAGTDYQANPAPGYVPAVDGYTWWAPVDAILSDSSPYGVIGMAGNVSEWTGSWDAGKTFVVVRGGNFKSNSDQALLTSALKVYPDTATQTLGFRTASDTAPGAGKTTAVP
jgi:formylglycine-generating enzyme required for sulfatase activity/CheY-like chemotaxis protein